MLFWPNKEGFFFVKNSGILVLIQWYFGANTVVFWTNTVLFLINTVVFGGKYRGVLGILVIF